MPSRRERRQFDQASLDPRPGGERRPAAHAGDAWRRPPKTAPRSRGDPAGQCHRRRRPVAVSRRSPGDCGNSMVDNGNGTWSYTPAANYSGPVSFNYTASDGSLSASSTASLTLAAVNDAPVAAPVTLAAGTEDTAYTITAATLLAEVTDVDGPRCRSPWVSVASGGGSIVNNGNGTWSYTPAANYSGPVSFTYTASDGSLSANSTASLTLAAVNDAPVATPVTLAAGTEDTAYTITAATLFAESPTSTARRCRSRRSAWRAVAAVSSTMATAPGAIHRQPITAARSSFTTPPSDGSLSASSTASLTPRRQSTMRRWPAPVTLAAGTEDTAYTITAATLSPPSHRCRRPLTVDHVGQRGERRRQYRQQWQRHLELHAGSQLQRPGQLHLYRFRRLAECELDRQPDACASQRCVGDHGGIVRQ